jgi:hypothetical protein
MLGDNRRAVAVPAGGLRLTYWGIMRFNLCYPMVSPLRAAVLPTDAESNRVGHLPTLCLFGTDEPDETKLRSNIPRRI